MPDPTSETARGPVTVAVASALAVGLAALAACIRDAPLPALQVRDVTFSRIDWAGPEGPPFQPASLWGAVSWSYEPPERGVRYLSLRGWSREGEIVWLLRDLPLFPAAPGAGTVSEMAYFDLGLLGWEEGEAVPQLRYTLSVSPDPGEPPATPRYRAVAPVTPELHRFCARGDDLGEPDEDAAGAPGDGGEEPADGDGPGAPAGPEEGGGTAERAGAPREIRPVQEGTRKCMSGVFARSLDWLNRVHDLGLPDEPQAIYDSLIAAGVSRRGEGGNSGWIGIKARWAREATGGRVVTKVWDGAGIIDPIDGVDEETPADIGFTPWLRRELEAGEDVELAYQERSRMGGQRYTHIITVVELYERRGRWWIRYRDDEDQGSPRGDRTVKRAKLIERGDTTHIHRFGRRIRFAVSESVETQ